MDEPVWEHVAGKWGVVRENEVWYAVRRETRVYSPSEHKTDAEDLARWFDQAEELNKH